MSESGPEKFIASIPQERIVTADGVVYGRDLVASSPDVTDDEAKDAIAGFYDIDRSDVILPGDTHDKAQRVRKVFGFSNWSGSNWQPQGPKNNPKLN